MDLSRLLSMTQTLPAYQKLKDALSESQAGLLRLAATEAVRPFLVAAIHRDLNSPVLVVTTQSEDARRIYEELLVWSPNSSSVHLVPETDLLSEKSTYDVSATADRLKVLSRLAKCQAAMSNDRPPLIVSSVLAAAVTTIPRDNFKKYCHRLEVGMEIDPIKLAARWQNMGYEFGNIVEIPGTVSRRGGIIDIFSPDNEFPARIELTGNRLESIRFFDPRTQRSLHMTPMVSVAPATEAHAHSSGDTVLDYLSAEALLIMDDPDELKIALDKLISELEEIDEMEPDVQKNASLPAVTWPAFDQKINRIGKRLTFYPWNDDYHRQSVHQLPLLGVPRFGGRLEAFSRGLQQMLEGNRRVVVVSQQTNRLAELLEERNIVASSVERVEQVPASKSITLVRGSLSEGWALKDVFTILTDNEIFGFAKKRRITAKRPVRYHLFAPELTIGEYVVHIDHGIARFAGLTRIVTEGIEREYLILEYAAGDRLYVPTDQVDCLSRYIGASDQTPSLSRLGTQEWARTKKRIKESVANIARELLSLYASREVIPGFAFSSDTIWQQELESSFPYMETADQLEAVSAVKNDMEKLKPMDRLVCGDVGYGKTEVALRAAFKAIMDGKQVALLVPTTVLAQQHFVTFNERLQAFPVKVEMLSRFRTEKEQADVVAGLLAGTVDICIGTHRLLQKDVVFKDLGLVIIDEEQRFGVVHKEHFKKLRQEIDVLTLSATPIPRTLHMSLAGIRDMSTIDTPPEERLPIKTYIGAYDDRLIREVILRELERGGQVFFVHNRVHSIDMAAGRLSRSVPEARISIAHGRVPEDELEKVMSDFINHKNDVLVTTTIIESGLDIPSVNTLIVDHADNLGLTQLYQLRGRVGRGSTTAYAYFLYDRGRQLKPEARKRLKTISEATELGAGFAVAMKDLEIRGAGNLLGVEQSGYIAAVGFDLYSRLLSEAVDELKPGGEQKKPAASLPSIVLPLPAFIPEEYIPDLSHRLSFYQRLASVKRPCDIEDIERELSDRFGQPPAEVANLLYVVKVRQLAAEADLESLLTENRQIVLQFKTDLDLHKVYLPADARHGIKVGKDRVKLDIKLLGGTWQQVLKELLLHLNNRKGLET